MSAEIPPEVWIDLAPAARLVARDPTSTRETSFSGPARVRACVDHGEESWLLRGVFESAPGSGERPGGEEWVVTSLGVIRYASAGFRVAIADRRGEASKVDIRVTQGAAFVWGATDATLQTAVDAGAASAGHEDGWVRLDAGVNAALQAGTALAPEDAATHATTHCAALSKSAKEVGDRIGEPAANLSDLAPKHVIARRLARAACRVALLRSEALPPSAKRDAAIETARAADASWRTLSEERGGLAP